ncbi:MAG: hypothetical protein ACO1RX_09010 [Candidatus Sericytochromatia bacterium]
MEKKDIFDMGLYSLFSAYFSFARTLADNRENGKRGWPLVSLLIINSAIAVTGGLITGPVSEIVGMNRAWSLVLASMIGWVGIASFMVVLETLVKRRMGAYGSPADSGSGCANQPLPVQADSEPTA